MKNSPENKTAASRQPKNAAEAPACVANAENRVTTREDSQNASELPGSEASQAIRRVRKMLAMPHESDDELLYYLKIALNCPQNHASGASGDIPLSDVVDAFEKAVESPEAARGLANIEEHFYLVDHPEEFSECEELVYSGVDVADIIRRTEIESAEVTAFDMVRLFMSRCPNAKAGLALCAVAAGFAAK